MLRAALLLAARRGAAQPLQAAAAGAPAAGAAWPRAALELLGGGGGGSGSGVSGSRAAAAAAAADAAPLPMGPPAAEAGGGSSSGAGAGAAPAGAPDPPSRPGRGGDWPAAPPRRRGPPRGDDLLRGIQTAPSLLDLEDLLDASLRSLTYVHLGAAAMRAARLWASAARGGGAGGGAGAGAAADPRLARQLQRLMRQLEGMFERALPMLPPRWAGCGGCGRGGAACGS
jgi:hypothetical protein